MIRADAKMLTLEERAELKSWLGPAKRSYSFNNRLAVRTTHLTGPRRGALASLDPTFAIDISLLDTIDQSERERGNPLHIGLIPCWISLERLEIFRGCIPWGLLRVGT